MTFRTAAIIVFLGSFCFMVIEIVAGRIIAPYLGSSLYSWTSVIGVFLTGITVGNAMGGVVADRHPSRMLLGKVFFLAAFMTAFIPAFTPSAGTFLSTSAIPLPLATLLFSFILFFPASFFLSFISPIAVKLVLTDLAKTGSVVGKLYAVSAAGSIGGTFAAGFFFIAYLGTFRILWLIAIALFALFVVLSGTAFIRHRRMALLVAFFLTGIPAFVQGRCTTESRYYCIRLSPIIEEGKEGYTVQLDHLVHSYVFPKDPSLLKYDYEQLSSWFIARSASRGESLDVLFLGGGGYTLPRYLAAFYPESRVTVVELDPQVTEINYAFLALPRDTPIRTVTDDARRFLARLPSDAHYDIIVGDVFNDFSVPFHLTTQEFVSLVQRHLKPDGFYLANTIDDARAGRFLASMLVTFRSVFPYTYLAPLHKEWEEGQRNTFLLVGSRIPFDTAFDGVIPRGREAKVEEERNNLTALFANDVVDAVIKKYRGIVLTDTYAPVDQFLAAVFRYAR